MPLPPIFETVAAGDSIVPVWLNLRGGITARLGSDRYLKWSPGDSLAGEIERLRWAADFHPVPRILQQGSDPTGDWFATTAIDGTSAVNADPMAAARALGAGLRALHEDLPAENCPFTWGPSDRGATAAPPPIDRLVVCHGDACVPNTLVGSDGEWLAHVDLGSLGVADRWADLAVASWSLDANFGLKWQPAFFEAYGVEPDESRLAYYRELWHGVPS